MKQITTTKQITIVAKNKLIKTEDSTFLHGNGYQLAVK